MGVFSSGGIGIDMGSGSTAVYLENEGVKLREPTCALVNRENASDVLALGRPGAPTTRASSSPRSSTAA